MQDGEGCGLVGGAGGVVGGGLAPPQPEPAGTGVQVGAGGVGCGCVLGLLAWGWGRGLGRSCACPTRFQAVPPRLGAAKFSTGSFANSFSANECQIIAGQLPP